MVCSKEGTETIKAKVGYRQGQRRTHIRLRQDTNRNKGGICTRQDQERIERSERDEKVIMNPILLNSCPLLLVSPFLICLSCTYYMDKMLVVMLTIMLNNNCKNNDENNDKINKGTK